MRVARAAVLAVLLSLLATSSAGALDIETEVSLPDAEVGASYSFQFGATEGCLPYRFSYSSGRLPPGLTIGADGELTGMPTEAGTFDFWLQVDDACGSFPSQGRYELEVLPDLAVATSSLPPATAGQPYTQRLAALNKEEAWELLWSVKAGQLPPGLALAEDGTISGTPTSVGAFTFTVGVRERFRRTGDKELTLTVTSPLVATHAPIPGGEVGVPFRLRLSQTGGFGAVTWSVVSGSLPGGLSLDAANGEVAGVPTFSGRFSATFQVSDGYGASARTAVSFQLAPHVSIATTGLGDAARGVVYSKQVRARGGVGPYTWSLSGGTLPPGIRLGRTTGQLSGVARGPARTYRLTFKATDRLGGTSTKTLALTVT